MQRGLLNLNQMWRNVKVSYIYQLLCANTVSAEWLLSTETGQTELNTAHQDTGTLLTTAPKDTGTKLTTAPKDTGTEQKTANQANQGIIKIFYTTGDGMKGETVESSGNCLMSCNFKAGPCPGYCGENGYCLVTGLTLMGDMFYTCVVWKTKVTKVAPLMG